MTSGIGAIRAGVASAVRGDFPELELWVAWVAVPPGRRSPSALRDRLAAVDDRHRLLPLGGLRVDPVAAAYRAFARQIGLDPDVDRNPLERIAHERLLAGRLVSEGPMADALAVAMLETGVPLWALDGARVRGWPRVDAAADGLLVLADDHGPLVPLMADPDPSLRPAAGRGAAATALVYALQVARVPASTVGEAFWHVGACVADREHVR